MGPYPGPKRLADDDAIRRGVLLAGTLLIGAGVVDAVVAYATTSPDRFVIATGDNLFLLDITGWTWLLVIVSTAVAAAGVLVLARRRWTSAVGLGFGLVGLGLNLAFLPYVPLQTILVAGLTVAAARLLLRHLFPPRPSSSLRPLR
ncbi:hypothetical protein QTQ03_00430 [Micromonospora sp. WMMA1363]|uniref:DUF7144 family membrane protein n=1 Tax=Micromonospora sp. WMMA1363 TaxID=3053985 RepID=UPI00259CD310|nr:hypothetical protein [Micromonospora sp. WMMA1363]MDM4718129.1 hypothetical protein [Micromonospora sp. WMMA1363]